LYNIYDQSEDAGQAAGEQKQQVKRELMEFLKLVFYFLLVFTVVRWYGVESYEIDGPSMEPTLQHGDRILVFKLPHVLSQFSPFHGLQALKPNDIVVFQSPDTPDKRYVKRVIAKGAHAPALNTVDAKQREDGQPDADGVRVEYSRGDLFINRHRVEEPYVPEYANQRRESYGEVVLGSGQYYVLGDNRDNSKDSRSFGPVDDRRIVGKAVLRFWPLSKFSLVR
jgi:signal peptidase I